VTELLETVEAFRKALDAERAHGRTVGLVPTMGYLHEGHASLLKRAAAECDVVAMTIFVNPLQFAPTEDLAAYPRDLDRDYALAEREGASLLFVPPLEEMYPQRVLTAVRVAELGDRLEGQSRPTHFAGVSTVVAKLFAIAGPCRAYFGEKDFQQLAIVRRMAADLSFPVEIVSCPTVRENDGLALSSRNAYLTPEERAAAPVVYRALREAAARIGAGETDPAAVREAMRAAIAAEKLAELDYAEVVDAHELIVPDRLTGEVRLLVAARFGRARLIDNVGVTVP